MGFLSYLFFPWSLILQVIAVVHFIRKRPAQYWIYVILFLGPIGALIYLIMEAAPDLAASGQVFSGYSRGKRIHMLEAAVGDNPSAGNFEELGDLYLEQGRFAEARTAYDKAIAARADHPDPFYHRAVCALQLGDATAAIPDFERVVAKDPAHDFHRAAGLLAQACALAGQKEKAEALFLKAAAASTLSETYLNFADFLAAQGRVTEACGWAQKVIDKERTMPPYLRRRERPWLGRARDTLKRLAVQGSITPSH
jgi:hypothetical protein